jgi:Ca2+-transporting ATPase
VGAEPVAAPRRSTAGAGRNQLAKAGAIMKRLASTQTLGSTSAINSDKTGTLTLNQMTAVQMTAAGRRYAVEGRAIRPPGGSPGLAGRRTSRWMSSWC